MRRYKVFYIHWETDGHDWEMLELPQQVAVSLDKDDDPEDCLADKLSDIFGWLVNSFDYEYVQE